MKLLRLAILFTTAASLAQTPSITVGKDNRSIAITATERVTSDADTATVNIGYQLFGPDKDSAYATGSKASNTIIDALRKAGVADDAIESQSQSIAATQPYLVEKLSPADKLAHAFSIQQSWTVRSNAADAAKILDLAVKAGANNAGQIEWSLHDPNAAQAEAASKALQRARSVASSMAAGLGVKLGGLIYASNEVEGQPIRPMPRAMAGMSIQAQKVEVLAINPRRIDTSATVYAVFAIE
jgi:uncharacterized protein YggE